jgi:hypothetical protein
VKQSWNNLLYRLFTICLLFELGRSRIGRQGLLFANMSDGIMIKNPMFYGSLITLDEGFATKSRFCNKVKRVV